MNKTSVLNIYVILDEIFMKINLNSGELPQCSGIVSDEVNANVFSVFYAIDMLGDGSMDFFLLGKESNFVEVDYLILVMIEYAI